MSKGFSLIELMIVVAVIGILVAIAAPFYQDYVAKTKITEALALASSYKGRIIDFQTENGESKCPTNRGSYIKPEAEIIDASLPLPLEFGNKNIHAMVFGKSLQGLGTCGIWIQFSENNLPGIARQYILLREDQDEKSVAGQQAIRKTGSSEWICETRIPEKYLPSVCKRRPSVSVSILYEGSLPHNPMY